MPEHLIFCTAFAAGDDSAINAYRLNDESGSLELLHRNTDIDQPFFLALSPNRKFLYATNCTTDFEADDCDVVAFEIVGTDGELKRLNTSSARGATTCYLDVNPSGKCLVLANYSGGSVAAMPIRDDGSLGEITSHIQLKGGSMVNADRQEGPHLHCAELSADGNLMCACDLGNDKVMIYRLDADSATLTPNQAQPFVATQGGAGPRHFTIHPTGKYAYANNEMSNSVNVYVFDAAAGTLVEQQVISSLPDDFTDETYTADIKITPCGTYLYCSNRGHDSIAAYRIGDDGSLALIEIASSRGNFAQNILITPDGGTLLCANMDGWSKGAANIAVFRIDKDSGKLSALGDTVALPTPSCLMLV
jgi:6-phosphogluconolactonase